jgi:16S rRNA (guanine966-N2)-methyltransferase
VAGTLSGRRLIAPPSGPGPVTTRPTTDKVREAVFNALASRNELDDAEVVDLFAGSGALGIEALSRGARRCTFVERDSRALEALRTNLTHLGITASAQVIMGDVMSRLAQLPPVDVALADPPYDFDRWDELLAGLNARLVIAESDRTLVAPDGWTVTRSRRYGRAWVTWFEQVP